MGKSFLGLNPIHQMIWKTGYTDLIQYLPGFNTQTLQSVPRGRTPGSNPRKPPTKKQKIPSGKKVTKTPKKKERRPRKKPRTQVRFRQIQESLQDSGAGNWYVKRGRRNSPYGGATYV